MIEYPLSIRDVSPHPDAIRLNGTRRDGVTDGTHTGGAWRLGDEVFKPLDGRPWANCEAHCQTHEDEFLEENQDIDLFPKNWHVEERNGRRFLVRPFAEIVSLDDLTKKEMLHVEMAIRNVNQRGWEIGNLITLGRCKYRLFVVDLSNAHRISPIWQADERYRIMEFFKSADAMLLYNLRNNARKALHDYQIANKAMSYKHIYASFNRPMDGMWAKFPGNNVTYVYENHPGWQTSTPHTWVLSEKPVGEDKIKSYELEWGYSPLHGSD